MSKYRIIEYETYCLVEKKGWIFWHVVEDICIDGLVVPHIFNSYQDAKDYIDSVNKKPKIYYL